MGIIPNFPGTIGVLTSDYLDSYFDKIITVSNNIADVTFVADNYTEVSTIAGDYSAIISAASTLEAESIAVREAVDAINTDLADAEALVVTMLASQVATEAAEAATLAARDATYVYQTNAEADAAQVAADLATIQGIIDDTGINTISLDLGSRIDSTATLTYGAR